MTLYVKNRSGSYDVIGRNRRNGGGYQTGVIGTTNNPQSNTIDNRTPGSVASGERLADVKAKEASEQAQANYDAARNSVIASLNISARKSDTPNRYSTYKDANGNTVVSQYTSGYALQKEGAKRLFATTGEVIYQFPAPKAPATTKSSSSAEQKHTASPEDMFADAIARSAEREQTANMNSKRAYDTVKALVPVPYVGALAAAVITGPLDIVFTRIPIAVDKAQLTGRALVANPQSILPAYSDTARTDAIGTSRAARFRDFNTGEYTEESIVGGLLIYGAPLLASAGQARFIGKQFVPTEEVVSSKFLEGQKYPTASPESTVKLAQKEGVVYSASPDRLAAGQNTVDILTQQQKVDAGLPLSESGGLYAAPKISPQFTGLVTGDSDGYRFNPFPTAGKAPSVQVVATEVERLPKEVVQKGFTAANLFIDTQAAKKFPGVAYTSPANEILGKTESEVIIPGGSTLVRTREYSKISRLLGTDFDKYTNVPTKVPEFAGQDVPTAKVALREYTNAGFIGSKELPEFKGAISVEEYSGYSKGSKGSVGLPSIGSIGSRSSSKSPAVRLYSFGSSNGSSEPSSNSIVGSPSYKQSASSSRLYSPPKSSVYMPYRSSSLRRASSESPVYSPGSSPSLAPRSPLPRNGGLLPLLPTLGGGLNNNPRKRAGARAKKVDKYLPSLTAAAFDFTTTKKQSSTGYSGLELRPIEKLTHKVSHALDRATKEISKTLKKK